MEQMDQPGGGVVTRRRCVYDKEKSPHRILRVQLTWFRCGRTPERCRPSMPTKILPIEAMPLTKNGKVDRAALLALSREAAARRRARTKKREKDL
ncbi:MAG: hypothetical protein ACLSGS_11330 [Adlercreutzia sp.]